MSRFQMEKHLFLRKRRINKIFEISRGDEYTLYPKNFLSLLGAIFYYINSFKYLLQFILMYKRKNIFLTKNYKETKFHPLLSEFMEMVAWEAQCRFPDNFRGLMAYFTEGGLKDSYEIKYFWVDNSERGEDILPSGTKVLHTTKEDMFKRRLYDCSYQIANSVQALGSVNTSIYLKKPDYSNLDYLDKLVMEFKPDDSLLKQLTFYFLEEVIFNDSEIKLENIFYYKDAGIGNLSHICNKGKIWIETINKALDLTEKLNPFIDLNANKITKFLALEGLKVFV